MIYIAHDIVVIYLGIAIVLYVKNSFRTLTVARDNDFMHWLLSQLTPHAADRSYMIKYE